MMRVAVKAMSFYDHSGGDHFNHDPYKRSIRKVQTGSSRVAFLPQIDLIRPFNDTFVPLPLRNRAERVCP